MQVGVMLTMIGFLSGSVMYSYLIPKFFLHIDIRQNTSDSNPGGANAVAKSGPLVGAICILLDISKGFIPIFVSVSIFQLSGYIIIPIILAPVLGHAFSPWLKFKGGKAVATSYGVFLGTLFISYGLLFLVVVSIIFQFLLVIKPNSTKTITIFSVTALLILLIEQNLAVKIAFFLVTLIVVLKHLLNPNHEAFQLYIGKWLVFNGINEKAKKN